MSIPAKTPIGQTIPRTSGIKYAGSKLKLLPQILGLIDELNVRYVLDGFSGSTRVSQALAQRGYDVTSSDIAVWSEVFAQCFLLNQHEARYYEPMIQHLNALQGFDGWFTENYGGDLATMKRPFQRKNTRKLDAIRTEIDCMGLNIIERAVLLTSLMLALDRVDSTLGHFASYLSAWSPRSHRDLVLEVPPLFQSTGANEVLRGDVFGTIAERSFDLAYFDPPYGSNNEKMPPSRVRYASYYHFWTTVVLNDQPELFGKANRRADSRDAVAASVFEEFRKDEAGNFIALEALKRLVAATDARYIVLSYSSSGRATNEEVRTLLDASGNLLRIVEVNHRQNVMSLMRWTNEWIPEGNTSSNSAHREYLFLLEKS